MCSQSQQLYIPLGCTFVECIEYFEVVAAELEAARAATPPELVAGGNSGGDFAEKILEQ